MDQPVWNRIASICTRLLLAGLISLFAATPGSAQGLVAYYQFNGNASDSSGLGNNGTPVNVVSCADRNGVAGQAYRFNGSSYVEYPDSVYDQAKAGFTWSVWVQPDQGATEKWGIMYRGTINGEVSAGWTGSAYNLSLKFVNSGWTGVTTPNCGTGLAHVVFILEKGVRGEIWVNGQLEASFVPPNEDLNIDPYYVTSAGIGAFRTPWGAINYFHGVIDDVRIYNRALTPTEVAQLYAQEKPAAMTGPETTSVLQEGDAAPGLSGAIFKSVRVPAINNSLHVAFHATVTGTSAAATKAIGHSKAGIWADDSTGTRQLIALVGKSAPGTPGCKFSELSNPVYNNHDVLAFMGDLAHGSGDVVTYGPAANFRGLWSTEGGALHLVARKGQQAPGCSSGLLFSSFRQVALPDQGGANNTGGVVFLATVSGKGVSWATNQGIWAVDTGGDLQLIIREGTRLNGKEVKDLSFLAPAAGATGQTRSYTQNTGDILYKATFTDNSWAVYKVVFP